ncbi:ABC transporter substrate-binding protein [Aliidongia dinghuensis]|uniref:ABC transporter substrate-binding protein n=1 Tax=Aliidongia dinghuensis TaxID=1867774 RepID=A0A8J2YVX8_9PROT|nr:ABC transporter substrate-binding protein [Aliidongia dinghuensis]GGF28757.1 ABC transporter substrate-binding protein [Aliidongia dinghuensis]
MSWKLPVLALAAAATLAAAAQAAGLPDRIAQAKTIKVAVNAIYPPMEFKDPQSGTLTGFDVDLGEALAKELGVKFDWQESAFEQLLPSLATGRADLILSGLSDRPERRESADFIDYLNSGAQFFVLAERAGEFKVPTDLCGKAVGSSRSTSFPKSIEEWSKANCEAAGKPAIQVVGTEDTASARLQLKQRRLDAAVQGSETIPYAMTLEPNTYQPLGTPFTSVSQGIAFTKQDAALRDAVLAALKKLMADGTYAKIIAKWHLEASAARQITLNGAPLP